MLPKACDRPSCPHRAAQGRALCAAHAARADAERARAAQGYDRERGCAARRGYDRRWADYSRERLARYPGCARCDSLATLTDHIDPVESRDDPRFWDPRNHQSLCDRCHEVKKAEEKSAGKGRNARV